MRTLESTLHQLVLSMTTQKERKERKKEDEMRMTVKRSQLSKRVRECAFKYLVKPLRHQYLNTKKITFRVLIMCYIYMNSVRIKKGMAKKTWELLDVESTCCYGIQFEIFWEVYGYQESINTRSWVWKLSPFYTRGETTHATLNIFFSFMIWISILII